MREEELIKALSDPEEFKRFIKSNKDLNETAEQFPNHAEELIARVLSDPAEFKRLVKSNLDLQATAKQFPTYKILQSKTIEEALEKVTKKIELNQVRDASSTLGQAHRDPNSSFFTTLPAELLKIIAVDTGDKDKVTKKEADAEANKVFNKPPKK